jgi:hypothetical protein
MMLFRYSILATLFLSIPTVQFVEVVRYEIYYSGSGKASNFLFRKCVVRISGGALNKKAQVFFLSSARQMLRYFFLFPMAQQPLMGQGLLIIEA